jgi:hypothetical protein
MEPMAVFFLLVIVFTIYKIITTDDWPKKWRRIKFETQMSWIGISGSVSDRFYRSVDVVGEKISK